MAPLQYHSYYPLCCSTEPKEAMASNCFFTFFCVAVLNILLLISITKTSTSAAAAAPPHEFKVGGTHGWHRLDQNHTHFYTLWASRRTFRVGDSLRQFPLFFIFKYLHPFIFNSVRTLFCFIYLSGIFLTCL